MIIQQFLFPFAKILSEAIFSFILIDQIEIFLFIFTGNSHSLYLVGSKLVDEGILSEKSKVWTNNINLKDVMKNIEQLVITNPEDVVAYINRG